MRPIITILCLSLLAVLANSQLLYLVNLYRHGARYPLAKNPVYDSAETVANAGQLSASGMRQQYNLGRYLRKDYVENAKLLRLNFNHTEMEAFSTTSLRTVLSAYCQLYGLYPDGTGPTIPDGIDPSYLQPPFTSSQLEQAPSDFGIPNGFQPIPVHDATPYIENCASVENLIVAQVEKHLEQIAFIDLYYMPLYLRMRDTFNLNSTLELNIAYMAELYDVIACDRYLGRKLPDNFTQEDYNNLRHLAHYIMLTAYADTVSKALSTPFFQKIIYEFDMKLKNTSSFRKFSMFSGHDTNVAPTLTFLNLSSAKCIQDKWRNNSAGYVNCQDGPDFAANINIQLYDSAKPTVKIMYNGKYVNMCDRKSTECDYSEWKSRVERQYVDYKTLCGNKFTQENQLGGQAIEKLPGIVRRLLRDYKVISAQ